MSNTITYAGVRIDSYSVREAIQKAEEFFDNGRVNTIETISMKTLVAAAEDEKIRDCLRGVDLVIPGDKEILELAEDIPQEYIRETEERLFFYEFMKLAAEKGKSCYLLSRTAEDAQELSRLLEYLYGDRIRICGSCALSSYTGEEEDIINEINGALPDMILSILTSPKQEYFLREHVHKIPACVWYGIGAENDVTDSRQGLKTWFNKQKSRYKMRRMLSE